MSKEIATIDSVTARMRWIVAKETAKDVVIIIV